jgi:hypothetical protein
VGEWAGPGHRAPRNPHARHGVLRRRRQLFAQVGHLLLHLVVDVRLLVAIVSEERGAATEAHLARRRVPMVTPSATPASAAATTTATIPHAVHVVVHVVVAVPVATAARAASTHPFRQHGGDVSQRHAVAPVGGLNLLEGLDHLLAVVLGEQVPDALRDAALQLRERHAPGLVRAEAVADLLQEVVLVLVVVLVGVAHVQVERVAVAAIAAAAAAAEATKNALLHHTAAESLEADHLMRAVCEKNRTI